MSDDLQTLGSAIPAPLDATEVMRRQLEHANTNNATFRKRITDLEEENRILSTKVRRVAAFGPACIEIERLSRRLGDHHLSAQDRAACDQRMQALQTNIKRYLESEDPKDRESFEYAIAAQVKNGELEERHRAEMTELTRDLSGQAALAVDVLKRGYEQQLENLRGNTDEWMKEVERWKKRATARRVTVRALIEILDDIVDHLRGYEGTMAAGVRRRCLRALEAHRT